MNLLRILLLLTVSVCSNLSGQIIKTSQIETIRSFIDKDCWILFDLDNTLFQAKQALGHTEWFEHEMNERIKNGMTKEEAISDFNPHWVESQKICEVMPVEPQTPALIEELQQNGFIIMGFTHRPCSVIDSTLKQVASIGVDFSKSTILKDDTVLPAKKDKAMHTHGIIFSGSHNPKGDILELFFQHVGHRPKKIIFIDDKDYNILGLESTLANTDIEYIGVHYHGIDNHPKIFNPEIAKIQFEWMNKIISNEMALRLVEENI